MLSGDIERTFSLNAATLDASAMKLPLSQAMGSRRPCGRSPLPGVGLGHLERRFAAFGNSVSDSDGMGCTCVAG